MFLKLTVGYSNARRFVGTRGETRVVKMQPVSDLYMTDLFVPSFVLSLEPDDEAVGGREGLEVEAGDGNLAGDDTVDSGSSVPVQSDESYSFDR